MKNYYRVMLGRKSAHAAECFAGNFIGTDFGLKNDLTGNLSDNLREFNRAFIPIFLVNNPEKSKVSAGLACGAIWTVSKGIRPGDMVLCPDGSGRYRLGEISGEYFYSPEGILPHRRTVRWLDMYIDRSEMSESLRNSTGSIGTLSDISKHRAEIENFLQLQAPPNVPALSDDDLESIAQFSMEKYLEEFLVQNWANTELGKNFDIYEEDGEKVGQQYPTDTGPLDVLAISKDRKTLLVVELKKGRG